MASSHLKQQHENLDIQMQQEINSITAQYQTQVNQLEHNRPGSNIIIIDPVTWAVAAIILAFFTMGISLVVYAVILFGIKAINDSRREETAEKNRQVDNQIREINRKRDAKIAETRKKYDSKKAQVEAAFKNKVKAARNKYAGKTNSKPIVDWLVDRFDKEIRGIDRSPHIKQLSATFSFRVESYRISTLKFISSYSQYSSGSYGANEVFDLTKNLFTHLNDFEDRVGFAQAMAKFVQFEITSRYPKDPLAPCAIKPTVNITSDDDTMYIHYNVPNGKYQHATKL